MAHTAAVSVWGPGGDGLDRHRSLSDGRIGAESDRSPTRRRCRPRAGGLHAARVCACRGSSLTLCFSPLLFAESCSSISHLASEPKMLASHDRITVASPSCFQP